MSSDENSNESEESSKQTVKAASNAVANVISKLMALKKSSPKVFFGAIGGLVIVILILMMSGGSDKKLPQTKQTNIAIGQTYELRSANSYGANTTVRLVSVPASMAAFDDTEAEDRKGDCKHMPQGTKAKAVQTTNYNQIQFVQVEMLAGECAGRKGWVIASNVK